MKENDKQREQKSQKTGWQKLSKKRWIYPAIYLAAVALILTGVLWMQSINNKNDVADKSPKENQDVLLSQGNDKEAVPANTSSEVFQMPVADPDAVEIEKQFYDVNGSKDEQQAALVNYDNSYRQNTGIDIVAKDEKSFSVTAAMSGTVEKAEQDELLGYVVVLKHKDGVETYYESLDSVSVKPGDEVSQGDVLGKAGRSSFNKDAGIHAHFEIRKDNVPVDPVAYFKKDISSLSDVKATTSVPKSPESKEKGKTKDENTKDNNTQDNNKDNTNNKDMSPNQDNNNAPNDNNNTNDSNTPDNSTNNG